MGKFFFLLLPLIVFLGLSGCQTTSEETYIKPNFKVVRVYQNPEDNKQNGTKQLKETKYKIRIDGNWYSADQEENLTQAGKLQLQQAKQRSDNDGGGGSGGGC
jgi:hypothetical protein